MNEAPPAILAHKDLLDLLDLTAKLDLQDTLAQTGHLASVDLLARLEPKVFQGNRDHRDNREPLVNRAHRVGEVNRALKVRKDPPATLDLAVAVVTVATLDLKDPLVALATRDLKERWDLLAVLELLVCRVYLVPPAHQVKTAHLDYLEPLAPPVSLVSLVQGERGVSQERWVFKEHGEPQERGDRPALSGKLDWLEPLELLVIVVTPVLLATWVCLENEDLKGREDQRDLPDLKGNLDVTEREDLPESRVLWDLQVFLVRREFMPLKETVGTLGPLVKLASVAKQVVLDPLVTLGLKDCLVFLVPQESKALVGRLDKVDRRVTPVLKGTLESKDPLENLVSAEQTETKVIPESPELQGPWDNQVNRDPQAHQVNRAHRALQD